MTEKHPQFVFSNKIKWIETNYSLKNDAGLDYEDTDAYYVVSIIYKHRDSVAVFDGGVSAMGREFDVEKSPPPLTTSFARSKNLPSFLKAKKCRWW